MTTNVTSTVTIETCAALVRECIKEHQPSMVWGAPGIGKSEMYEQIARELGIGFKVIIPSIKQPVDFTGLPVPDLTTKTTIWLRPSDLPTVERDGEFGILFIDEINACAPSMQAAMFQLVLEGRVGEHCLPKGWIVVAAGNRISDRAAAQRMPTALKNRFSHFNVEPDVDSWAKWAAGAGVNPYLIAFLKFRKELLHIMPGETKDRVGVPADANSFPTPRSWVKAGKFLDRPSAIRLPLVAAQVGEGPAAELEGFLRVCASVPTITEILADPAGAKVPTDPAGKYAVAGLLCRSADRKNFGKLLDYAKRLGREFEVLTAVDAVKRQPDLANTGEFGAWAVANQDIRI